MGLVHICSTGVTQLVKFWCAVLLQDEKYNGRLYQDVLAATMFSVESSLQCSSITDSVGSALIMLMGV